MHNRQEDKRYKNIFEEYSGADKLVNIKTIPHRTDILKRASYLNIDIYTYINYLGFYYDLSDVDINSNNLITYLHQAYPLHVLPSIIHMKKLYPNLYTVLCAKATVNNTKNTREFKYCKQYLETLGYTLGEAKIQERENSLISYFHETYNYNKGLINVLTTRFRISNTEFACILGLSKQTLCSKLKSVTGKSPFTLPYNNEITDTDIINTIKYMVKNKLYTYEDAKKEIYVRIAWDITDICNPYIAILYKHESALKFYINPTGVVQKLLYENNYYKYNDLDFDIIKYIDDNLQDYKRLTWDNQVRYAYDAKLLTSSYFGSKLKTIKKITKKPFAEYYKFIGRPRFTAKDRHLKDVHSILSKYLIKGKTEYKYLIIDDEDYKQIQFIRNLLRISTYELCLNLNIKCFKLLRKSKATARIEYLKTELKKLCIKDNLVHIPANSDIYTKLYEIGNKYYTTMDKVLEEFGYKRVRLSDIAFLSKDDNQK